MIGLIEIYSTSSSLLLYEVCKLNLVRNDQIIKQMALRIGALILASCGFINANLISVGETHFLVVNPQNPQVSFPSEIYSENEDTDGEHFASQQVALRPDSQKDSTNWVQEEDNKSYVNQVFTEYANSQEKGKRKGSFSIIEDSKQSHDQQKPLPSKTNVVITSTVIGIKPVVTQVNIDDCQDKPKQVPETSKPKPEDHIQEDSQQTKKAPSTAVKVAVKQGEEKTCCNSQPIKPPVQDQQTHKIGEQLVQSFNNLLKSTIKEIANAKTYPQVPATQSKQVKSGGQEGLKAIVVTQKLLATQQCESNSDSSSVHIHQTIGKHNRH